MRLAIVGAGAAGLGAAFALRDAGFALTVFEKSRGPGGRATTRRRTTDAGRFCYDHGAQYAKPAPGSRIHRLLADGLPAEGLYDIPGPVWPFDGDGVRHPADAVDDGAPKWTYADGLSTLGHRLADAAGVALHTQTRIERLERTADTWTLHADDGTAYGPFDAVLLTPPAPQGADLLDDSTFDPARRAALGAALRQATYRPQFALVWAFDRPLPRPGPFYALVNPDGRHAVAWLAFETDKPGRAPAGWTLLLAQMSPAWTRAHYDAPPAALAKAALPSVGVLLGAALPAPVWSDVQRWRYALPDTPADAAALADGAALGLFFAGDALAGRGRVHLALESGFDAADALRAYAASRTS